MATQNMNFEPTPDQHPGAALLKLLLAWLGYAVGSITLQQIVLALTGVYTLLQIYLLVRDKIIRDRARKECS
ncbi:MAG TPA: hypothetical protein VFM33_13855 [Aquabacterium sp.]|nr:hypothetical protein [Aquabacterium sp.]